MQQAARTSLAAQLAPFKVTRTYTDIHTHRDSRTLFAVSAARAQGSTQCEGTSSCARCHRQTDDKRKMFISSKSKSEHPKSLLSTSQSASLLSLTSTSLQQHSHWLRHSAYVSSSVATVAAASASSSACCRLAGTKSTRRRCCAASVAARV